MNTGAVGMQLKGVALLIHLIEQGIQVWVKRRFTAGKNQMRRGFQALQLREDAGEFLLSQPIGIPSQGRRRIQTVRTGEVTHLWRDGEDPHLFESLARVGERKLR